MVLRQRPPGLVERDSFLDVSRWVHTVIQKFKDSLVVARPIFPQPVLTEQAFDDVRAIREARRRGVPYAQLAEKFHTRIGTLSGIVSRRNYAWVD